MSEEPPSPSPEQNEVEAEVVEATEEADNALKPLSFHSSGDNISTYHTNIYAYLPDFARMRGMEDMSDADSLKNLQQFLHRVIDNAIGREVDLFTEFMGNVGNDARALEQIVESLTLLFNESVGHGLDPKSILEDLQTAGVDSQYARVAAEACYARREEIRKARISSLPRLCGQQLVDFGWKVVVAMASDQLSVLREPLVQLSLTLADADDKRRVITVEATRPEFDALLKSLEGANDILLGLSSAAASSSAE